MKLRVIKVALISGVQDEQSCNTGANKSRDEVAKHEIAWLSKWRLDGTKEKDSRRTERSDNGRRMIGVPEGRRGGHNGFDE